MGIARNKCRQAHRNRLCRQTIARTFAEDIRQYVHAENPEAPERLAVTQGQFARLVRCLARLRADERILLTLRYLKELPIPEVVELVGKSEAAVRKQLLRALRRLRQCMEDDAAGC
jgi:RNA polymerase sigma factor (sigma-70 family)